MLREKGERRGCRISPKLCSPGRLRPGLRAERTMVRLDGLPALGMDRQREHARCARGADEGVRPYINSLDRRRRLPWRIEERQR
jgi:hypothetical protein